METQSTDLSAWDTTPKQEVSTETLDDAVRQMQALRKIYELRKEGSNQAHAEYETQEAEVMKLLKAAGKSKYFVDGLGTAYIMNKYQIKVPKEASDKEKLFKYIEEKYGRDVMLEYSTVNYQKLNAFYNEEKEIVKDASFRLPGVPDVEHAEIIGFRKG